MEDLPRFAAEAGRTSCRYDVRTPEEFAAGHLPGFRSAPDGQLVQESDVSAPVPGTAGANRLGTPAQLAQWLQHEPAGHTAVPATDY